MEIDSLVQDFCAPSLQPLSPQRRHRDLAITDIVAPDLSGAGRATIRLLLETARLRQEQGGTNGYLGSVGLGSAMPRAVSDIFLSSTSADLQACRAKVSEMIARMRQTVIRMETFGAKPNKPLATCRNEVQDCDALIVIVGHRYGWVPEKEDGGDGETSITWWEVKWALDAGKPVYAFLIDPKAPWVGEREQDRLTAATTNDMYVKIGRAVRQLLAFRAFLEAETTREFFTSADDLGGKVAASLHDWLLRQALEAARGAYSGEETPLPSPAALPASKGESLTAVDDLYWKEQVHLLSAQNLVGSAEGIRIALIAGRANSDHPALAGASIKQFDARRHPRKSAADDFTTALAAFLVGFGSASTYRGIARQAHLLVLHVLDEDLGTNTADILAALDAAITEGVQVICLPLSGLEQSMIERNVYQRAADLGVLVVCPAGNEADAEPVFPAAYPSCVSVGAVDAYARLAAFSSFGDWVTTAAPGVGVLVAIGEDRYERWSGTSFSCAIVAGTIALMLKLNPALTPDGVRNILRDAGSPVLSAEFTKLAGNLKVLNAYEAVRLAGEAVKMKSKDKKEANRKRGSKPETQKSRSSR